MGEIIDEIIEKAKDVKDAVVDNTKDVSKKNKGHNGIIINQ